MFVSQPIGTFAAEAHRRRDIPQHFIHVSVVDSASENEIYLTKIFFILRCSRIKIGPNADELVEMVGAQNGGVPGQIVEVVHDHGDEEIEHLRRSKYFGI